jgi:hypothetical protein
MEIIGKIFLLLIALVGYSGGAVLGARGKRAMPGLTDLVLVGGLCAGVLATGDAVARWLVLLLWLGGGLLLGAGVGSLRAGSLATERQDSAPSHGNVSGFKRLKTAWAEFAVRMGNFQSRILVMGLYFSVVVPFGWGVRLLGDPLAMRKTPQGSGWVSRQKDTGSVEEARRQG